ncbi:MAG TPA: hypothetical protein ENI80_03040 [Acidiferrobacteraceae bacterium]|nr:hypothetical protein [Acidiferrobacteraceae bacterium]
MNKKTTLAFAVAAALGFTSPVSNATLGYFSHGYGAIQSSMGGAGVALPQDAMTGAINPAGMVMVGNSTVVGITSFHPIREYTITGTNGSFPPFVGGPVQSDNEVFLIPNFAYNKMLDKNSSIGVTVFGNGGMNSEYTDADTTFGAGTFGGAGAGDPNAGIDYKQLFINTTYARKVSDTVSIGITGIINHSRFKADGLAAFGGFSVAPTKLSNNGVDSTWGFGGKIGILAKVNSQLSFGASYQTKISNKMDKYAGLFPKGGEFDIPATATIGLAFKPDSKSAVTFDIQQIWYSDVDAVGNPGGVLTSGCMAGVMANCLGGSASAGFGWDDMTAFKIGYQRKTNGGWTWRAGFATGSQPISPSEVTLNILAPGVVENHFTFGFGKDLSHGKQLNVAVMYAPSNSVSGPSMLNPAETIEIKMKQYAFSVGLNF